MKAQPARWIVVTAFALLASTACIFLARWQLNRLHGRNDANRIITSNYDQRATPLARTVRPGQPLDTRTTWRTVTVQGTYDAADELLVRKRSLNESTGYWVLTPLDTSAGRIWAVRGWIRAGADARTPSLSPAPPTGRVSVTGHLRGLERTTQTQGLPDRQIQTINPSVINGSTSAATYQAWLQVTTEDPTPASTPTRLPNPDVSAGPHLGYVVQWIVFALLIWVGWWIIVRRPDAEPADDQSSP